MKTDRPLLAWLALAAIACISGCGGDTSPRGASTLRVLLDPGSVEKYVENRRQVLIGLKADAYSLDSRVAVSLRQLRRAQERRNEADQARAGSASARQGIEGQVIERQEQGERLRARLQVTQARIRDLETERIEAERDLETNRTYVARLNEEIANLSAQVQQFENLSAETIRQATEDALREPR